MTKLLMVFLVAIGTCGLAFAQNEESEEARQTAEKARRRHFPGGRDEQELTVQAVLPSPSRTPQDPKMETGSKAKEPVQDDLHD